MVQLRWYTACICQHHDCTHQCINCTTDPLCQARNLREHVGCRYHSCLVQGRSFFLPWRQGNRPSKDIVKMWCCACSMALANTQHVHGSGRWYLGRHKRHLLGMEDTSMPFYRGTCRLNIGRLASNLAAVKNISVVEKYIVPCQWSTMQVQQLQTNTLTVFHSGNSQLVCCVLGIFPAGHVLQLNCFLSSW